MDHSRFDDLSRALAAAATRRAGLKAALAGLLGMGLAAGDALAAPDAEKRRRKKKKCNPKCVNGFTCRKRECVCEQGLTCGASCCAFGQVCGGEGEPDCVPCPSGVSCAGLCCEANDTCVGAVCTPCETRNICDGVCCTASERCKDGTCKACDSQVGCGAACCNVGETCENGTCACASGVTCKGVCCLAGQACIDGACATCAGIVCAGACCAAGETCAGGACTCASGVTCSGTCCAAGQQCLSGGCGTCPSGLVCNGACCLEGQSCLTGGCATCASGVVCNGTCCPPGQQCLEGRCSGPAPTCTVTPGPDAAANGRALQAAIDSAESSDFLTLGEGTYDVANVGPHVIDGTDFYGILVEKNLKIVPCDPAGGTISIVSTASGPTRAGFVVDGAVLYLEGLELNGQDASGEKSGFGAVALAGVAMMYQCTVTGYGAGVAGQNTGTGSLLGGTLVTGNTAGLVGRVTCQNELNQVCGNGDGESAFNNCGLQIGGLGAACGCNTVDPGTCPF